MASAYSVRPLADARVSTPLTWDEVPTVEAEAFTIDTVPARFASVGDPGDGIDAAVGSLDGLLELSRRDEEKGLGDAPWPPNYAKQAGEPPRVQPSRARRRPPSTNRGAARLAGHRRRLLRRVPRRSLRVTRMPVSRRSGPGSRPTPTGRRRSSIPVVEIARAEHREQALEGLDRWKARHPCGRSVPRAGRHPRRRHARALVALVPRPGQPHPRAGGGAAGAGAPRVRLRSLGQHGHRGLEGRDGRVARPSPGVAIEAAESRADVGSRGGLAGPSTPGTRTTTALPPPITQAGHAAEAVDFGRPTRSAGRSSHRRVESARALVAMIEIVGIDHVQLSMPPGGEEQARAFYGEVLGLREVEKPAALAGRGGCWFANDRVVDPSRRGVRVQAAWRKLTRRCSSVTSTPPVPLSAWPGRRPRTMTAVLAVGRCYVRDPFGNRLELVDAADAGFLAALSRRPDTAAGRQSPPRRHA